MGAEHGKTKKQKNAKQEKEALTAADFITKVPADGSENAKPKQIDPKNGRGLRVVDTELRLDLRKENT